MRQQPARHHKAALLRQAETRAGDLGRSESSLMGKLAFTKLASGKLTESVQQHIADVAAVGRGAIVAVRINHRQWPRLHPFAV